MFKEALVREYFGTDGIRGVANASPMTVETATALGRAVATLLGNSTISRPRIVIGKDTRLSGYMFETAMAAGICSGGADVLLVGPLPTPGIAFITHSVRADAGVVISASHNPFQDNGIKIFSRDGFKLPDQMEEELEGLMAVGAPGCRVAGPRDIGRATRIEDAAGRYIVYLKNTFPRHLSLEGITIVVDCAHGASYKVAPTVFEELGARVIRLGCKPNGVNINLDCGALHPDRMRKAVQKYGAHIGIALDGDADRLILCDEKGEIIDGDQVMAVCALRMALNGSLAGNAVVATVMSNIGLEVALRKAGVSLVRTQVGDRYVVEEMRKGGYSLGGEQSGHLIFLQHSTTGDGVLAALRLLAIMQEEQKPLSQLVGVMERFPQSLVNVKVMEKRPIEELAEVQSLVQRIEGDLKGEGRVLVRYSGTEPKARVMVEGRDEAMVHAWAMEIADCLKRVLGG